VAVTAIQRQLDEAERRGLIERDYRHIAPTLMGKRFLNDLLQIFLPEKSGKSAGQETK
jgi:oxygen-independent coproporphyrinogen-3 oxidase